MRMKRGIQRSKEGSSMVVGALFIICPSSSLLRNPVLPRTLPSLGCWEKTDTHWHSDDIIITWAIGHLLELKYMDDYDEAFKNWRNTIERLPFIPDSFQYKPKGGRAKKQLSAIMKLIKDKSVTEIVNACDAAREGELIFRTIVEHSKVKTPTSRMWMQSMTYDAMLQAFEDGSREKATALQ